VHTQATDIFKKEGEYRRRGKEGGGEGRGGTILGYKQNIYKD
jgi:hypothetical protein